MRTSRTSPLTAGGGTSPPCRTTGSPRTNYDWVIDASEIGRDHPSTAGHAYLAERLADAIAAMGEGSDITADAG